MIPCILKGDDSGGVTISLAEGHNYEGATLVVVFNGVSREFTGLTAGGEVSLAFTADETAGMPLGTGLVEMRLIGPNGAVETVGNADARIKVTDCVAEVNAGGSFAVTPGVSPLADVEGLGTRCTTNQLRAKINEVIAKLGGTVAALALAIAIVPCLGGVTVQTAPLGEIYTDSPVVTNVTLDVSDKADVTNTYTKAETDARIIALAPTPGDYSTVSNRAMSALQSHQSLAPATNYTDTALGAFASTGAVARAATYGTPTRWTDATGCVWEVTHGWRVYTNGVVAAGWTAWNYPDDSVEDGIFWSLMIGLDEDAGSLAYTIANQILPSGTTPQWDSELTIIYNGDADYHGLTAGDAIRAVRGETNLVGRVALTNDLSGGVSEATVTNIAEAVVRAKSLGGIYDSKLGIWWTPGMADGALHYYATTNVNLNVEDDE